MRRSREAPALAAAGALQTLAFADHRLWWLPLLTISALFWRLDRAPSGWAAFLGWCYGTGWLAAGVWWLFISMHRYGGLPAWLSGLAVWALSAALSLYLALACAVHARLRNADGGDVWRFAALWLLAELARGVLFTGFPWLAAGYSQLDSPLVSLAPWIGVYGIGAAMAASSATLVRLIDSRGRKGRGPAVALLVLVVCSAVTPGFTRSTGQLEVVLLQTNVAQDEKFSAGQMPQTLAWVGQALLGARADLVLAPETAVPLLPDQLDQAAPGYWAALRKHFAEPGRAALVGVPLGDYDHGYTNSVVGLSAGTPYRYDKWHLVPFGEFIPAGFRWFTDLMNIPLGDFARGATHPPSFVVGAQRVAPNICYEDLFGEELARRFDDAATAPTIMANVSNLGWFGRTIAIRQHLDISRMRSLELQRPMLRATNTGATAIIDHRGQVSALLTPHTRGLLAGRVEGRSGSTPFARWASIAGLWPLLLLALAPLVIAWRRRGPAP